MEADLGLFARVGHGIGKIPILMSRRPRPDRFYQSTEMLESDSMIR